LEYHVRLPVIGQYDKWPTDVKQNFRGPVWAGVTQPSVLKADQEADFYADMRVIENLITL
jgi:hypothetical protein